MGYLGLASTLVPLGLTLQRQQVLGMDSWVRERQLVYGPLDCEEVRAALPVVFPAVQTSLRPFMVRKETEIEL